MIKKFISWMGVLFLFIGFILPWIIPVSYEGISPEKPFPESQFTEIYGTRLHYRVWNPTSHSPHCGKILLIHGFAGSTFSYRKLISPLQGMGYQIVALDLPAFGYSDRNINASTLPDAILALILLRKIDALNHDYSPWVLTGHSMGASVVAEIASAYPKICTKLILIDGVPALRPGNAGTGGLLTSALFRRWAAILGKYFFITPGRIQKLLSSAYGSDAETEAVQGYLKPLQLPETAEAILKKFRYGGIMPPQDLPQNLEIKVIWGEKDTWIPLLVGENFLTKYPQAQLTLIPGAGHIPMETHPNLCLKVFQCDTISTTK
jgi:pimeloyl-ACP methyl ester carboxylesterase